MKNRYLTVLALCCAVAVTPTLGSAGSPEADGGAPAPAGATGDQPEHEHDDPADHDLTFYEAIEVSERHYQKMFVAEADDFPQNLTPLTQIDPANFPDRCLGPLGFDEQTP